MYQYQPLPSGVSLGSAKPLTRILHLEPGCDDEPFRGRLEVTNAEKASPYEALSYCWGNEEPNSHMWIEESPLPIRPNLASAIKALRYRDKARRLWIDALCIDQSNLEERSRQVRYMRLIYRHCTKVIVWLGPMGPGVKDAFEAAKRIIESEALIRQVSSVSHLEGNLGGTVNLSSEVQTDILHTVRESLPTSSIKNLSDLFDREYFFRLWVLQEVVAGPNPTAKCGELEMSFLDLACCGEFISHFRGGDDMKKPQGLVWKTIIFDRDRAYKKGQDGTVEGSLGSLTVLLEKLRGFKSTDERDRIFSLLGISDEGLQPMKTLIHSVPGQYLPKLHKPATAVQNYINNHNSLRDITGPSELKPDYAKDTITVFTDVARYLIKKPPGSLDVLSHVQHRSQPPVDGYPSWVPKWFESDIYQPFNSIRHYDAGKWDLMVSTFWRVRPVIWSEAVAHPQRLKLEGFPVGTVQLVSDRMEIPICENSADVLLRVWSQLFPFPMIPRPAPAYRSGEPLDEAFCLALSAGSLGAKLGGVINTSGSTMGLVPQQKPPDTETAQQVTRRGVRGFLAALANSKGYSAGTPHPLHGWSPADINAWYMGVHYFSSNRKAFVTNTGHIGIGPNIIQPGDEVVVLYRGHMPYILRRRDDHHTYIGDCYVEDEDLMSGNVARRTRKGFGRSIGIYEVR